MKTTDLLNVLAAAVSGIAGIFAVFLMIAEKGSPMRAFCRFGLVLSSIVLSIIILLGLVFGGKGGISESKTRPGNQALPSLQHYLALVPRRRARLQPQLPPRHPRQS